MKSHSSKVPSCPECPWEKSLASLNPKRAYIFCNGEWWAYKRPNSRWIAVTAFIGRPWNRGNLWKLCDGANMSRSDWRIVAKANGDSA